MKPHPHDTPLSSGLRFLSELITWTVGPWVVWQSSPGLGVAAGIVLVALPSVFSTPGDKNTIVVATPGPVRLAIELLLYAVGALGPWLVWSLPVSLLCTSVIAASIITGIPRLLWLFRGAKSPAPAP
ncbi:MAG: DUF2568 domain-containing protein [Myxococcales bacterium]|nr:DUF2568 domain-containing protein [Myxococcales bacterium]